MTAMTDAEHIKMHQELLEQPMSFFESEPFMLERESIAMPDQDMFTDMTLILGEYHFDVDMITVPDEADSEPGEMLDEGDAERGDEQEGYVFSEL